MIQAPIHFWFTMHAVRFWFAVQAILLLVHGATYFPRDSPCGLFPGCSLLVNGVSYCIVPVHGASCFPLVHGSVFFFWLTPQVIFNYGLSYMFLVHRASCGPADSRCNLFFFLAQVIETQRIWPWATTSSLAHGGDCLDHLDRNRLICASRSPNYCDCWQGLFEAVRSLLQHSRLTRRKWHTRPSHIAAVLLLAKRRGSTVLSKAAVTTCILDCLFFSKKDREAIGLFEDPAISYDKLAEVRQRF